MLFMGITCPLDLVSVAFVFICLNGSYIEHWHFTGLGLYLNGS